MKNKEPKIEGLAGTNFIEINGKKYILERETTKKIDGVEHSDKLVFKRFNEREYIENLGIIISGISRKTTKKELLTEIFKTLDYKTIRRLAKRIKAKKLIKKHKGCLGFKVGDAYVQLLE